MNKLLSVKLERHYDHDYNPLEYLEKTDERYISWTKDDWHFIGIKAKANIAIPTSRDTHIFKLLNQVGCRGLRVIPMMNISHRL